MRSYAYLLLLYSTVMSGQVNVLTANYDNNRTNANTHETILTPGNVNQDGFGRLFALPVDGAVYAQPLYVSQLNVPGQGTHNVVFIETMHNTVFAFDADSWGGQPLWTASLGTPVPSATYFFADIEPEVGILSTPVIDAASNTMYVVSDNLDGGVCSYRLHAISIATGAEQPGSPVIIEGAVPGTSSDSENGVLTFNPLQHLQRPGLLLANGNVYIAFGSHADIQPYHGWVMAYNASNISRRVAQYCTSPNGNEGAIWQSGRGLAADAQGNIYASTGNGDFDGVSSFGESFLKLSPALALTDWFAPDSWLQYNEGDYDLGSSGIALIPGTDLMIGGGKIGTAFVVETSNLGHTEAGNGQVVQKFTPSIFGVFSMALWDGPTGPVLFAQNESDAIEGYQFLNGKFEDNASLISSAQTGSNYEGISVSSNGQTAGTGIVWVTTAPKNGLTQPATLLAIDAEKPTTTLWNSGLNPVDNLGYFAKFVPPMVANGKVYVATFSNEVVVYGLRKAVAAPQITELTNAASYATGAIAPGEIVTIFGVGMGAQDLDVQGEENESLSDSDAGTSVTFGGLPAPILYSSATAVAAVVPFGVSGDTVPVQVTYQGQQSLPFTSTLAPTLPGLFSIDASGANQGAFLNQDLSVNSTGNPATRGQVLVLYGTGLGLLNPAPIDGAIVAVPAPILTTAVTATIGGIAAQVQYAGAAPGSVAGLMQINVVIPQSVVPGNSVPVVVQAGNVASQSGVTAAIN